MKPDELRTRPFIDRWREKGYQYYIVPKSILRAGKPLGLGIDEVMLYAVLRDRAKLSVKNGWVDKQGRIYVVYGRAAAAAYIGWSERKARTVFARLVSAGLLMEEEVRSSKNNLMLSKRLFPRQWIEPSELHPAAELTKGGFPFLTEQNVFALEDYYIVPVSFFTDEALHGLTLRAIFLYMLILDAMHMSINFGKVDDDGKVWCSLDGKTVLEQLGCSERSLSGTYAELEGCGLLVRRRSRTGPMRLYLRDFMPPPVCWTPPSEEENVRQTLPPQDLPGVDADFAIPGGKVCRTQPQDLPGRDAGSAPSDPQGLPGNQPWNQPLENSFFSASIAPGGAEAPAKKENLLDFLYGQLQMQVEYGELCQDIANTVTDPEERETWYELTDTALMAMAKALSAPGVYLRLGDRVLPKESVKAGYLALDRYILYTVLSKTVPRLDTIRERTRYLQTALLTAHKDHEGEAYYTRRALDAARADRA